MQRVHTNLNSKSAQWGAASQEDAIHRMYAFLSRKEIMIIETHLQDLNRTHWSACDKTLYGYFQKYGIDSSIKAIAKISADKFPSRYNAAQHAHHDLDRPCTLSKV